MLLFESPCLRALKIGSGHFVLLKKSNRMNSGGLPSAFRARYTNERDLRQSKNPADASRVFFFSLRSVDDVGKESHVAGTLDRGGDHSLVLAAGSCDTAGRDLSGRRDVLPEELDILVVDMVDVVLAEVADLLSGFRSTIHSRSILSVSRTGLTRRAGRRPRNRCPHGRPCSWRQFLQAGHRLRRWLPCARGTGPTRR